MPGGKKPLAAAGCSSKREQRQLELLRARRHGHRVRLGEHVSGQHLAVRAPVVVSRLIPVIAAVAESGTGVLLIEQFATVALGLAGHAHIMEGGRIRFSGPARELRDNPALLRSAYLLRGSSDQPAAVPPPPAVIPDLSGRNRHRPSSSMTGRLDANQARAASRPWPGLGPAHTHNPPNGPWSQCPPSP